MSETFKLVDGQLVPLSPEDLAQRALDEANQRPPDPRYVPKLVLVERLAQAGLLRPAALALGISQPAASLTDNQLKMRERFAAAAVIASDDPDAVALITAIGGNPAVILAPV